jgi:hypothetical protein
MADRGCGEKTFTCSGLRPFPARRSNAEFGWGAIPMFDVYLNDRRDLLVVRKGLPIPPADVSGRWRKKKRAVSCQRGD